MRRTRMTALCLAAMLLLASCAGSGGADTSTASTAADTAASEPGATGPQSDEDGLLDGTGRFLETVTMTYSKVVDPGGLLPEGETPESNYVSDWLLERYNIDAQLAWTAEKSEYKNKLSLNIASGSLPDMVYVDDYLTFHQMVENDMLADLTDVYPKYRSEALASMDASFGDANLEAVSVNGRQYAIPSGNLGYGQNLLWLRKDWLDNLSLPVPKTLEDLELVLTAFVNDDPNGTGVNDTVGLPVHATAPVISEVGNQFGLETIFSAYECYPKHWLRDENGDIYYGSTDPSMKEALALLQDWYAKGLLDREFPTRIGTGETQAIFESGQAGAVFAPWWGVSEACFTNNNAAEFVAVAGPVAADGNFHYMAASAADSMMVVNKNFATPEAVVIALNAECDLNRGGADRSDPITSKYVDIWEKYRAEDLIDNTGHRSLGVQGQITFDRQDVVPLLGSRAKQLIETGSYDEYDGMSDFDKNQCASAKAFADGDRNAVNFWIYVSRYIGSNATTEGEPVNAAYYYTTESSPSLKPSLDKLEDQMYLQIIIGEKPVEYFDEFVEQWRSLGGDTLTREVQDLVG